MELHAAGILAALAAVVFGAQCVAGRAALALLFGAFAQSDDALSPEAPAVADLPEWDRWRNERESAK